MRQSKKDTFITSNIVAHYFYTVLCLVFIRMISRQRFNRKTESESGGVLSISLYDIDKKTSLKDVIKEVENISTYKIIDTIR